MGQHRRNIQDRELRLYQEVKRLRKKTSHLQGELLDMRDGMEKLQSESGNLTDLLHVALEGIRTESVDIHEIRNAVAGLYLLSDTITKQAEHMIRKAALQI